MAAVGETVLEGVVLVVGASSGIGRAIETNLIGTANVARAALRQFRAQGNGRLILLSSALGKTAIPYPSPYVSSKWAVHGLAAVLRMEARETPGIRVTVVSPGSV